MVRSNHKWRNVEEMLLLPRSDGCRLPPTSCRWRRRPRSVATAGGAAATADDAEADEAGAASAAVAPPRRCGRRCSSATARRRSTRSSEHAARDRPDRPIAVGGDVRWRRFTHAVHGEVVADRPRDDRRWHATLYRGIEGDDGAVTGYPIVSARMYGAQAARDRVRRRRDVHEADAAGSSPLKASSCRPTRTPAVAAAAAQGRRRQQAAPATGQYGCRQAAAPTLGLWRCKPGTSGSQAKRLEAARLLWLGSLVDA